MAALQSPLHLPNPREFNVVRANGSGNCELKDIRLDTMSRSLETQQPGGNDGECDGLDSARDLVVAV